jgi:hypothetical protein
VTTACIPYANTAVDAGRCQEQAIDGGRGIGAGLQPIAGHHCHAYEWEKRIFKFCKDLATFFKLYLFVKPLIDFLYLKIK